MKLRDLVVQRRAIPSSRTAVVVKIAGSVLALVIAGVVLQVSGRPTLALTTAALDYNLGSWFAVQETLLLAAPVVTAALAVYVCFRMRVWNIGIDGQMMMGASAATAVGLSVDAPSWFVLPLMAIAGAVGGGVWALVPALLKAHLQISEIITTVLLNLVALQVVLYLAIEVWRAPGVASRSSRPVPYELPMLTDILDVGVLLPIVVAVLVAVVFIRARAGFEISMAGGNPGAARAAGIEVRRRLVGVMATSGAIGGVSGMSQVAGSLHALSEDVASNAGLYGFIVAALANVSVLAVVVVGLLIAVLLHSGISLATDGVSTDVVMAIYGLILLLAGIGEVAGRYRFVVRRAAKPRSDDPAAPTDVATKERQAIR